MRIIFTLIFMLMTGSVWASETTCEDLSGLNLTKTDVNSAEVVTPGTLPESMTRGRNGPNPLFDDLPNFCRVQLSLHPSDDSDIKVEVWLPEKNWNGRLQAVGNGAFQSSIQYSAMARGLADGYAMVASNTGHEGNSGAPLIDHPEKLIDWGYRAVHEMTVTAKQIITARYGNPAEYSYWNSCSTGGRQGLIAGEYYPEDFDGLAVGDAANPMSRLQASTIYSSLTMNQSADSYMSPAKWQAYRKAVMDSCDATDGLEDGLLNDPMSCDFDPGNMQCMAGDNDSCLTAPQVSALKTMLAGMKNPRTGEQLFPGWPPGANPLGFVVGPEPEQVAVDTFRVLFNDPDWDFHSMDFDRDIARSDELGNPVINAADPSRLQAFFDRGGKLFMYHGWNDGSITPLQGINYYNSAVAANGGLEETYDSIRLFMAPGMNHCGGGEGPNAFDKMEVITQWVEEGVAPDRIVAAHKNTEGEVDRSRPLCPYPELAKYKGSGSIDDAGNFSCAAP